ncbi:MAG: ATP-dependent protease ATPase subunit HslU [Firmicutes bacterium]|nr:ATP-dependent protease ATPase subunit HslU [Bacillota bacterium]
MDEYSVDIHKTEQDENQEQPLLERKELTPRQIVAELDKHIVGQNEAKRSVAVVVRNRYRRQQLEQGLQDEIIPKNIIMIGPTGVGKTEIARRLAKLVDAPFIKVEATKFTEVGYVGRDVESIIRDLVETAIRMVKAERTAAVEDQARAAAELRILDMLQPLPNKGKLGTAIGNIFGGPVHEESSADNSEEAKNKEADIRRRRVWLRDQLSKGTLDKELLEIEVEDSSSNPTFGMEGMGIDMAGILGSMMPKKMIKRKVSIGEAKRLLTQEEAEKLIDNEEVTQTAIQRAEQSGIVFLDEIDKIAGGQGGHGPDVSRGGVQRDILPIVEGCTVMTKYGPVKTDYVLFIAAGAFHVCKPSDLMPELQGRFPIRVNLDNLSKDDLRRILLEPEHSLLQQYQALLAVDGVNVEFAEDGIDALAEIADQVNCNTDNIGARRLHTILEKVLEDLLYDAPEQASGLIRIDRPFVEEKLRDVAQNQDLSRFIL